MNRVHADVDLTPVEALKSLYDFWIIKPLILLFSKIKKDIKYCANS